MDLLKSIFNGVVSFLLGLFIMKKIDDVKEDKMESTISNEKVKNKQLKNEIEIKDFEDTIPDVTEKDITNESKIEAENIIKEGDTEVKTVDKDIESIKDSNKELKEVSTENNTSNNPKKDAVQNIKTSDKESDNVSDTYTISL